MRPMKVAVSSQAIHAWIIQRAEISQISPFPFHQACCNQVKRFAYSHPGTMLSRERQQRIDVCYWLIPALFLGYAFSCKAVE